MFTIYNSFQKIVTVAFDNVTSIRNVKFYKNALEYNVYHRCLCYFLNQVMRGCCIACFE